MQHRLNFMLKFEPTQTNKHFTNRLSGLKNWGFSTAQILFKLVELNCLKKTKSPTYL